MQFSRDLKVNKKPMKNNKHSEMDFPQFTERKETLITMRANCDF